MFNMSIQLNETPPHGPRGLVYGTLRCKVNLVYILVCGGKKIFEWIILPKNKLNVNLYMFGQTAILVLRSVTYCYIDFWMYQNYKYIISASFVSNFLA
jgi:hypothetical protein